MAATALARSGGGAGGCARRCPWKLGIRDGAPPYRRRRGSDPSACRRASTATTRIASTRELARCIFYTAGPVIPALCLCVVPVARLQSGPNARNLSGLEVAQNSKKTRKKREKNNFVEAKRHFMAATYGSVPTAGVGKRERAECERPSAWLRLGGLQAHWAAHDS